MRGVASPLPRAYADGSTAQTGTDETPEDGVWAVEAYPTLRQVLLLLFVCVRVRCRGVVRHESSRSKKKFEMRSVHSWGQKLCAVCLRLCVASCINVCMCHGARAALVRAVACHVGKSAAWRSELRRMLLRLGNAQGVSGACLSSNRNKSGVVEVEALEGGGRAPQP